MDPAFAELDRLARDSAWRAPGRPFSALARAIAGQQISVKAAASVWGRVLVAAGATADQPPGAKAIRDLGLDVLRSCGLSQRKAEYMHALADHFLQPEFSEQRLHQQPDHEIVTQLTAIRGIGVWSVEMFLMFHLHRPDVLPVGDLGLRAAAGSLFGDGAAMPAAPLRQLAATWRPQATAATWLLWRYLELDEAGRAAVRACSRSHAAARHN